MISTDEGSEKGVQNVALDDSVVSLYFTYRSSALRTLRSLRCHGTVWNNPQELSILLNLINLLHFQRLVQGSSRAEMVAWKDNYWLLIQVDVAVCFKLDIVDRSLLQLQRATLVTEGRIRTNLAADRRTLVTTGKKARASQITRKTIARCSTGHVARANMFAGPGTWFGARYAIGSANSSTS